MLPLSKLPSSQSSMRPRYLGYKAHLEMINEQ
jgi:hypothetical protein